MLFCSWFISLKNKLGSFGKESLSLHPVSGVREAFGAKLVQHTGSIKFLIIRMFGSEIRFTLVKRNFEKSLEV